MRKRIITIILAGILATSMSITAFAGWEQEGTNWKYNDNGTYAANGWIWIDGNNDGIAESYYFNDAGYMLVNTTTPDGYTVNADGAWTVNDVVQTQGAAVNTGSASTGGVNHSAGYDPAHPLAGKIDEWNLRLADTTTFIGLNSYICSESIQARLTGQMDYYNSSDIANYTSPVDGIYVAEKKRNYCLCFRGGL